MMKSSIRAGIFGITPGAGWAQAAHVPALKALEGFGIAAISARTTETVRSIAETLDIAAYYTNAADLAGDPSVDLVVVTVKVPDHRELVKAAIDAQKMVYCEWPLGNGLAQAEDMALDARNAMVRTIVGLQARSSPVIRYVRDLIKEGYVGEVLSTTLVGSGGNWGASASQRNVYTHDRTNGATLLTIPFGHTVDALCYCLGEFREVSATTAMRRKTFLVAETGEEMKMSTDDQVIVVGALESGAAVAIHYRGGSSRGTNLRWEINGSDGDLQITAASGHAQISELSLYGANGAKTKLEPMTIPAKYRLAPAELMGAAVNVAEAYLQFGLGDDAAFPVPDFDDAVIRHRLLDAIERSAVSGERVVLGSAT